jgi:hypothetical protein
MNAESFLHSGAGGSDGTAYQAARQSVIASGVAVSSPYVSVGPDGRDAPRFDVLNTQTTWGNGPDREPFTGQPGVDEEVAFTAGGPSSHVVTPEHKSSHGLGWPAR